MAQWRDGWSTGSSNVNEIKYYVMHPVTYREFILGMERGSTIVHEWFPLAQMEWAEVHDDTRFGAFNPDVVIGKLYEKSGSLLTFTVRLEHTRQLVGYCFVTVSRNMKNASQRIAAEHGIYLTPTYRQGFLAMKLVNYMESTLHRIGVTELVLSHRPETPRIGDLYGKMGYKPLAISYHKSLVHGGNSNVA